MPGDAHHRGASLQAIEEVEERELALADAHRVDVGVMREHLPGERRGVRPADDDGAPVGGAP